MVTLNPNRPLLAVDVDFTAGPPGVSGNARMSLEAPQRRMAVRQLQTQRGRQYELDQTQAGTATLAIVDPLEHLNPLNGSSAFLAGGGLLIPYRAVTISAFWPLTGNLFNTGVNTSFDSSFETGTSTFAAGTGATVASNTTHAFVGTHGLQVTQPNATSAAWTTVKVPAVPGVTATVSVYAYLTGGANLQIRCPDGTNSTTLSTQTTFTRITVTYTMVEAVDTITFAGTVSSTPTFWLDAFQVEFASAASAYTASGPTRYLLYRGYIERYPRAYDMSGKRGNGPLTAVDALAIMSRTAITQNYDATITADAPILYAPLNDTTDPGVFTIGGANFSKSPSPSPSGEFNWAGDTNLDGINCLSLVQRNPDTPPSSGTGTRYLSEWNTVAGSVSINTRVGATFECWVKYVAGNITPLQIGVVGDGKTFQPDQQYLLLTSLYGVLQAVIADNTTSLAQALIVLPVHSQGYADNAWHYLAISFNAGDVFVTFDNTETGGVPSPLPAIIWGVNNIHFDAYTGLGDPTSQMSLSRIAVYNRDLGSTVRQSHYKRGSGNSGELSGTRVARLLAAYWGGATSVAAGQAQMYADFSYDTRTMLDVLEEIQDTERGLLYVNTAGAVVFEDRGSRYANQVALWTFGENAGEYPYVDYAADFDPTYLFTQANIARPGNSNFKPLVNTAAQALYGQRILTQTVQVNTDFDLTQTGNFYLTRYGAPKVRLSKLTLDPSSNPALWPVVLSLELSQRVTVKRRSDSLSTSADYYIEQISHNVDSDRGTWTVDLQLSPVWVPSAWILGDATYGVLGTTTIPVF